MHQEDFTSGDSVDEQYYAAYTDISLHELMLSDEPRMTFYKDALSQETVGGKIVVDVGAGSGVLSCFAALSGAHHVFSVEASDLAMLLPTIMKDNHVSERVTVLHSSMEDLVADGALAFVESNPVIKGRGVSIVVSEWMGFYLLHEGMLASVLEARDFFSEVNRLVGVSATLELIPSHGSIMVAPISLAPFKDSFLQKWKNVRGVNLSHLGLIGYEERLGSTPVVEVFPDACLLDDSKPLWSAAFADISADELHSISKKIPFELSKSDRFRRHLSHAAADHALLDGFLLWFSVYFQGGELSTSPQSPPTHWKQTATIFPREYREAQIIRLTAEDDVTVDLHLEVSPESNRFYTISTEIS